MFKVLGDRLATPSGAILPLSAGVEFQNVVYLSGALPLVNGKIVGSDIETQANAMFDNVQALLEKEGLSLRNVFKVTGWLVQGRFRWLQPSFCAAIRGAFPCENNTH